MSEKEVNHVTCVHLTIIEFFQILVNIQVALFGLLHCLRSNFVIYLTTVKVSKLPADYFSCQRLDYLDHSRIVI
jgi:hypothetical protein